MYREKAITCLVDDELNAARLLQNLLQPFHIFGAVSVFTNATEAFTAIVEQQPDYIFLDIQMPEINGLQLAEKIKPHLHGAKIIFVTAYDQYAIEALRQNAFDYLLKPVVKSELIRIVDKLLSERAESTVLPNNKHLMVHGLEGIHYVSYDDILFLEAEGSYTSLVLKTGKRILSTMNLGKIASEFQGTMFIRISRKHLVNRNYFTFYNSKEKFIRLEVPGMEYRLEVTLKVHDLKQLLDE